MTLSQGTTLPEISRIAYPKPPEDLSNPHPYARKAKSTRKPADKPRKDTASGRKTISNFASTKY